MANLRGQKTLSELQDERNAAAINQRLADASAQAKADYTRQRQQQQAMQPIEGKFPWKDFDDVLSGDLDVDTFGERVFSRMNSISPDIKRNGKTPIEIAEEAGKEELVDVLQRLSGGRRRKSRKLRLNVKRRGTKRHGRSGKHSKLRKLSTRRR